ncbi:MAG: AraC family transcriptional regulator [Frankiales bacterium]|nr:AraC family transcriptional regulator [Frankiales bacterium]
MRANTANLRARPHQVAIVVYDGVSMFEFAVACEVFGYDDPSDLGADWYQFAVCAARPGMISLQNRLRIDAPYGLRKLAQADTVIVPPCYGADGVPPEVLAALRRAHGRGARLVSLCTGAMVLAEAGLLSGRRVTTHWAECADLADRYPDVAVDADVLYVDGGDILTSAGSAASLDLCLHVVRLDYGAEVATRLARQLVIPPYRDGGQAQYIESPVPEVEQHDLFAEALAWAQQHLAGSVTVTQLAARSAMSRRTFARRFAATNGTTPYQWLLRQRLQLAQRLLETGDLPVELVAEHSGFVNAGNLRKHFARTLHTTPQAYRHTFRSRPLAVPAGPLAIVQHLASG